MESNYFPYILALVCEPYLKHATKLMNNLLCLTGLLTISGEKKKTLAGIFMLEHKGRDAEDSSVQ